MKTIIFFFGRILFAWLLMFIATSAFFNVTGLDFLMDLVVVVLLAALVLLLLDAASHLHHVQLMDGELEPGKLKNRHRRQIEIPFGEEIALPMLKACFHELKSIEELKVSQDGKRLQAVVPATDNDRIDHSLWKKICNKLGFERPNHVVANATVANGSVSVSLSCGPGGAAWADSFFLDEGVNLQNAETITRAISRHIAECRRDEQASAKETATEKELAVAKLNLLHAQVEPHFLYNTLGSAKYLISIDPVSAETMLGNLILYLRHSLPRDDDRASTLGEEVERARAYLDILKIRMGERLKVTIEVPQTLLGIPFPTMMLQTLVENSVNHGLEPKSGGGNIWISARTAQSPAGAVTVTVADDGIGFGSGTSGTGIGLRNVRERLKLAYGSAASFSIVANFPNGVAASISVPAEVPKTAP
ncbi:MAG: histidine kinase [Rhodanobacteraceae bacterium]|nr:histidine kinase [Rhodanobacteraceae bacterium]